MVAVGPHEEVWTARRRMVGDLLAELRERALATDDSRAVRLVETNFSWVLLGPEAYKIKKPLTLPFLDFSTYEAREEACRTEVRLNRRLAPCTYLGVVAVRRRSNGRFTFNAGGAVVDWAVRMVRLDDETRADVLLERDALTHAHVDAIAHALALFHARCPSNPRLARFGAPEVVEQNVVENFVSLSRSIGGVDDQPSPHESDELALR